MSCYTRIYVALDVHKKDFCGNRAVFPVLQNMCQNVLHLFHLEEMNPVFSHYCRSGDTSTHVSSNKLGFNCCNCFLIFHHPWHIISMVHMHFSTYCNFYNYLACTAGMLVDAWKYNVFLGLMLIMQRVNIDFHDIALLIM